MAANDDSVPFSVGREQGCADDNEFILLELADFLRAEWRDAAGRAPAPRPVLAATEA